MTAFALQPHSPPSSTIFSLTTRRVRFSSSPRPHSLQADQHFFCTLTLCQKPPLLLHQKFPRPFRVRARQTPLSPLLSGTHRFQSHTGIIITSLTFNEDTYAISIASCPCNGALAHNLSRPESDPGTVSTASTVYWLQRITHCDLSPSKSVSATSTLCH